MRLAAFISAVMAKQAFPRRNAFLHVQSQWRIAIRAAHDMTAIAAEDVRGRAAPVQEQDGLLLALECRLQLLKQAPAKDPALARLQLIPHVHDLDGRQSRFENAAR